MNKLKPLEIRNIKISVILKEDIKMELPLISKEQNFVITIYPNSRRLINITKLKSVKDIYTISKLIVERFNVKIDKVRIDSIFLGRKIIGRKFSTEKMIQSCKNHGNGIFKLNFDVELFHAPFIRSKFGSFNMFGSGSVTCMGVRSVNDIKQIESFLSIVYCKENEIK